MCVSPGVVLSRRMCSTNIHATATRWVAAIVATGERYRRCHLELLLHPKKLDSDSSSINGGRGAECGRGVQTVRRNLLRDEPAEAAGDGLRDWGAVRAQGDSGRQSLCGLMVVSDGISHAGIPAACR